MEHKHFFVDGSDDGSNFQYCIFCGVHKFKESMM